MQNNSSPLSR